MLTPAGRNVQDGSRLVELFQWEQFSGTRFVGVRARSAEQVPKVHSTQKLLSSKAAKNLIEVPRRLLLHCACLVKGHAKKRHSEWRMCMERFGISQIKRTPIMY